MSTFQGSEVQKNRIEMAIRDGMKETARKLWPSQYEKKDYDTVTDPEDVRMLVEPTIWQLVYRGWFDFNVK